MNRISAAIAGIGTAVARTTAAVGGGLSLAGAMVFRRIRGGYLLLARTTIDYRSEIGDPATNSIVGAVVGWVARNFPVPVRIVHEGTTNVAYPPADTGPGAMLRLLENPNPYYSGILQWRATLVDWLCAGNAYWIKVRSGAGRPVELWWVPQRMMEPRWPENDPSVFIGWYEYTVDGIRYRIETRDVVHFRNGIDPLNPRKGLSPLASLFREIFTDDEASNFTAALLKNLGVPGVVISPSNTVAGRTVSPDVEAVKRNFMDKFGGDKRGEPLVFSAPTDVKVLSFNPQQMELRQLRRIPEERISAVIGVPAGVAQLGAGLDRNTFTNYGEANVAAYTQGVIPSHGLFDADLDAQLLVDFAGNDHAALDVWHDWTQAPAMAATAEAIWQRYKGAAVVGLVTRAAFKRATGQPVATDGSDDVYIYPNNYVVSRVDAPPPRPPAARIPSSGSSGALLPGEPSTNGHASELVAA